MKKSKIIRFYLILIILLSGFNFIPQLKIEGFPLVQVITAISIIFFFGLNNRIKSPKYRIAEYYGLYLLTSIPALLLSIYNNEINNSLVTYFYALAPFLLFIYSYNFINETVYKNFLIALNLSVFLIVIVGWLIRFNILPINIFFDVKSAEFALGYWGIHYTPSTRNHDYLYPLVGLSISGYFFVKNQNRILHLILIFLFILTLIASFSRGAIIITIISVLLIFNRTSKFNKIIIAVILLMTIILNYKFISVQVETKYSDIISSIFKTKNKDSRFSNEDRLKIIQDAVRFSTINPIGYGIENFSSIYKLTNTTSRRISNSAENAFLTILVERGWLAFIFFTLLMYRFGKYAFNKNYNGLIKFIAPMLILYFLFNYELNNFFACFIFYILFLDVYLHKSTQNSYENG